eukprot:COSAG06_NODE_5515_length_3431_cov_2.020408_2_plen_219_part_00
MCGRLLLAYPLHLVCGALTGLQLVRHHLLEGEDEAAAALHWGWLLVPAILTHGTYDSVLFVLAAFMPSVAGGSEEEEEEPRSVAELDAVDFWGMVEQLAILLPLGWLYLAIPLYWMRRKLRQIDLPALYAKAVGESDGDGAGDQGASGGGGGGGDYGLSMGMAMQPPPLSQQQQQGQQGQEEEGGEARDRSLVPMLEASGGGGGGGGGRDSLLAAGVI